MLRGSHSHIRARNEFQPPGQGLLPSPSPRRLASQLRSSHGPACRAFPPCLARVNADSDPFKAGGSRFVASPTTSRARTTANQVFLSAEKVSKVIAATKPGLAPDSRRCRRDNRGRCARSYGNGFTEYVLADPRLEGAFHHEIDLDPEEVAEMVFERDELQETWSLVERRQDIEVAPGAPRRRASESLPCPSPGARPPPISWPKSSTLRTPGNASSLPLDTLFDFLDCGSDSLNRLN